MTECSWPWILENGMSCVSVSKFYLDSLHCCSGAAAVPRGDDAVSHSLTIAVLALQEPE